MAATAPQVVPAEQMQMHLHMQQQQRLFVPAEMEQPYRFHELPSPDGGNYVYEKPAY
jgi:hypothetical protein